MTRRIFVVIGLCGILVQGIILAQQQDTLRQREEMPKLEIPEITIIGKKAITLPFARKGEIYDVDIYDAPRSDSSLLGQPPSMSLLRGSLPRYRQEEMPWRCSVEGLLGSFSSLGGRAYLNYISQTWGIGGNGGFKHTNGHTANADASSFAAEGDFHSLVRTDNAALKTFRASLGMGFEHNTYGLFGVPGPALRRRTDAFGLNALFGSVNRLGTVFDIELGAKFLSLNDKTGTADSSVSAVSPVLRAALNADIKSATLKAGLSYRSSSLEYAIPTQSPSLFEGTLSAQWRPTNILSLEAGGTLAYSTDIGGDEHTLVLPLASARWDFDSILAVTLWFKPGTIFTPYESYMKQIPYLARHVAIEPERRPVAGGSSIFYNQGPLSVEVRGSFIRSSNIAIQIADSGKIRLEFAEANQTSIEMEGAIRLTNVSRLLFDGTVNTTHEQGSSTQLPMVPTVHATGRWETDFRIPVKAWASVEYLSPRNVDRQGTQSLGNVFLLNAGGSITLLRNLVIAGEVDNLADTGYEWWSGYVAPGIQFNLSAKINLR